MSSRVSPDDPRRGLAGPQPDGLIQFLLAQRPIRHALEDGAIVQFCASGAERKEALFPNTATVEVNSGDAREALKSVQEIRGEAPLILIPDALQFLTETRQFLGACFSKLAVGGMMVVVVPHQFLYERKWKLPSRRNPLHRRFYTPNTLLADIEEAIDPCEFRVRFLADHDGGYDYRAELASEPDGGQDIVLALEKISRPEWRPGLDDDEIWAHAALRPVRYIEIDRSAPEIVRTITPDKHGVDRIVLVKLDHRGDFLLASEAFKIFRGAFPSAEITLVCGSWNAGEAKKSGYFDHVLSFDFFPEDDSARLDTEPRERLVAKFAKDLSGQVFDLAVDLRLSDDTRQVLRAISARNRAGFDRYDSFPWLTIRLNLPSATEDDRAEHGIFSAESFATSLCKHLSYEIRLDTPYRSEKWRAVVWGPYRELKPGHYQFECLIEPLAEDFEAAFDIVCDKGRQTLMSGVLPVARAKRPRLEIEIAGGIEEFEFRLIAFPGYDLKPFRFFGLRFLRPGIVRGVHQIEAMALLARLVELRLANAYVTELEG